MKPMPAVPMPLTLGDLWRASRAGPGASARLEDAICEYHGAEAAYGLSSGRAALWMALRALHHARPDRDTVIVPSYTCPTVGRAVVEAGLRGRCADVSVTTFNIDPARVAEVIDDRVLAVVAPHMFGLPCDLIALRDICHAAGAYLIEDCAQCVGGRRAGERVGTQSDAAFLSMGRSKNVRGYEGGVLWTDRAELVAAFDEQFVQLPRSRSGTGDQLRQAVITIASKPYPWAVARRLPGLKVGAEDQSFDPHPSKLADWQAGLGLISLSRAEEYNEIRRALVRELLEALNGVGLVQAQEVPDDAESTCLRFATRVVGMEEGARDRIVARLQSQNIDARAFYTNAMNGYEWWNDAAEPEQTQRAEQVVATNMILPVYAGASAEDCTALAAELAWASTS